MKNRGFHIIFIVLLAVANLFLKGWNIDANAIALDEPFSIYHAQFPVSEIIANLKGGNNPPLYEIILHYWIGFFGIDPWSVRLPSVIFATVSAIIVYLIGARFISRFVGVISATLFTLSNYALMISQEARAYSLLMMLFMMAVYQLLSAIKKPFNLWSGLLFGITCALMSYTHYFGFFITLLLMMFYLMGSASNQGALKKLGFSFVVYLLCFGWYIPDLVVRILDTTSTGTWVQRMENLGNLHDAVMWWSNGNKYLYLAVVLVLWGGVWMMIKRSKVGGILKWLTLLVIVPGFIAIGYSIFYPMPLLWKLTSSKWFSMAFAVSILIAWLFQFYYSKRYKWILTGLLLLPLLGLYLISFEVPLFSQKYVSFLWPMVCVLMAMAIEMVVQSRGTRVLLAGGVLIWFGMTMKWAEPNHRDADAFVGFASGLQRDDTKVILGPMQYRFTFLYHYDRNRFRDFRNVDRHLETLNIFPVIGYPEVSEQILNNDQHVLFVDANTQTMYPNNGIVSYLTERFTLVSKHSFEGGYEIFQFVRLDK